MDNLLLHSKTKYALERFISSPAHALLLVGMSGTGKKALAREIARKLLKLSEQKLINYPYFMDINVTDQSIGIEESRKLENFLSLKTVGSEEIRRIAIINDAHYMTPEAQNAILKTLEEPPEDSVIIMTTGAESKLRPTVLSRLQKVRVLPVSLEAALRYFSGSGINQTSVKNAYHLSQGAAGHLQALLKKDSTHPLRQSVITAKELMHKSTFERLLVINELVKEKAQVETLIDATTRILTAALRQSVESEGTSTASWVHRLNQLQATKKAYQANANTKLLLCDLFLGL